MSNSIMISEQMDNITTIIFQNTADQMFTGVIDLTALNYKKNVGHLMRALLSTLGFVCSDDGKTLSHSSNPTAKLKWRQPASRSRKPADFARPTLLGQLEGLDLTHDDGTPRAGSRGLWRASCHVRSRRKARRQQRRTRSSAHWSGRWARCMSSCSASSRRAGARRVRSSCRCHRRSPLRRWRQSWVARRCTAWSSAALVATHCLRLSSRLA